ncbi:MAG: ribonuclease R [Patescibacteria group bacterium]
MKKDLNLHKNSFQKAANKKITGIISINSKGKGFISLPDAGKDDEDIVVQPENIGLALHGDTVEAETFAGYRGALEGKIISVAERKKTKFVGVVMRGTKNPNNFYLEPDDHRAHITIHLANANEGEFTGKVHEGQKAFAEIVLDNWTEEKGRIPDGRLLEIIGEKGDNNAEMHAIVLERGFDTTFPADVLEEADAASKKLSAFSAEELSERRDFRDTFTCTIDPIDAKDFDDALSLKDMDEKDEQGRPLVEIGIHIADVAHYVVPGTALDREARKRAFSVYLVDRTIPMLPHVLSNGVCSLNPNEDRFAFSAVFIMDRDAKIRDRWFGRTIIHSNKRFTYENAQEVLTASKITPTGEFAAELLEFNRLAKVMLARRKEKGAIDFDSTEIKFKLDENGKPIAVYKKERIDTHRLVEEFMLLANKEVAEYIYNKNKNAHIHLTGVYRVHDLPDQEKLHDLATFVNALGLDFHPGKTITPKDVQHLIDQSVGHGAEAAIKVATLRSMAKALYSTKNVGHFGLAFEYYTHFTSPIRRYPDLSVHRILADVLKGKPVTQEMVATLEKICQDSSRREIEAADAERASIKYKQVEFMMDRVGQTFEATISGIAEWGMYVEEPEAKAEGLIRVRDLPGDFYTVDQKNYKIVGEKTKREFQLGQKIKVTLNSADLDNRMLNFSIAE